MLRFLSYLAVMLLLSVICSTVYASHNRAGEITYAWLYGSTYQITVITYTKADSQADRCELEVFWGDGDRDTLLRSNGDSNTVCGLNVGEGVIVGTNIRRNEYVGVHTYPGPGVYRITMLDPNRNAEVTNMQDSFNTPFFIFLTFMIGTGPNGLDTNGGPMILNPPIDEACSDKLFIHNAGAYDIEGDSISYVMNKCYEGQDPTAPFDLWTALGYITPPDVTIDPVTGDLIWDTPPPISGVNDPTLGGRGFDEYNICFEILEWRNGVIVSRVQRDMQITVWACENDPPVVFAPDTCVLAGSTLTIPVAASDPNNSSASLTLTASGGPMVLTNSPATFTVLPPSPTQANGELNWQTNCSHVRKQPYSINFKVEDNDPEVSLVGIETVAITVIAPAPANPTSSPSGNNITVSWDKSICTNAIGYKIYRRNGSFTGTIECPCETGVPGFAGYNLLATVQGVNTLTYKDNNNGAGLIHGVDYCYRIVASFADGAESCASVETCSQLTLDVPIITHVSVGTTSTSSGIDTVIWAMPKLLDDSIQFTGPYRYDIYRSNGFDFSTGSTLVASTPTDTVLQDTDTLYIDSGLDTETGPHAYQIMLYSGSDTVGATHIASSIFLSIAPYDNRLDLAWQVNVPWNNAEYFIYRLNNVTLNFDLIDSTSSRFYSDSGLVNGAEYCYFVKSVGSYSVTGIVNPIINYSQESCEIPQDRTPPCPPTLVVTPNCLLNENTLSWNNPNNSCADDVKYYNVYYTPILGGDLELLQSVSPAVQTSLLLENLSSIAGCYAITAVDSANNESVLSDSACVDNCPIYALPNVFNPDGNGLNDFFVPCGCDECGCPEDKYKFVDRIDLKIFNRWGQLVFETTDPDINWDGKYFRNGQDVAQGVYYYVCEVFMIRLTGIETKTLTGFVHVLGERPANTN